jgi:hypothetical protein
MMRQHGMNPNMMGQPNTNPNQQQSDNKDEPPKVKSPEVKKEDDELSGEGSDQDSDQDDDKKTNQSNSSNQSNQSNQSQNTSIPNPGFDPQNQPQQFNPQIMHNQQNQGMQHIPQMMPGQFPNGIPFIPNMNMPNLPPWRGPYPPHFQGGKIDPNSYPGMPMAPGQYNNPMQFKGNFDSYGDIEPHCIKFLEQNPPPDPILEKLPASKTPVIDAFIYCSISNWGVSIKPSPDRVPTTFVINDFNKYWELSQKICSKPAPTETQVARLKALRRWFADFPGIKKIKSVKEGKEPIIIKVKQERLPEVVTIIKKYSQMINSRCKNIVTGDHRMQ